MSNQSNPSNEKPRTFQDIIREIEQKSVGGGYIYRGERKLHTEHPYNGKVSSSLWREFYIEQGTFDIEIIQKEMVRAAKKHAGYLSEDSRANPNRLSVFARGFSDINIDHEILIEIQHYGGKTNLIDFTTDYFIALFFACDGCYDEDGRVVLQKTDKIISMITHPRNPRHRVIAQKSVFIRPPKGFIEPRGEEIVIIPANLKQDILGHLRNYHSISTEAIYNDLHGFIRNQDIHGEAYTNFYRGLACQKRADKATTLEVRKKEYEKAITHYTKAIEFKPDFASAYNNRGNAYGFKGDFDNAIQDFNTAIQLQPELSIAYSNRGVEYSKQNDYERSIEDYTQAIQLKPDPWIYYNRGEAWLHLREWEKAKLDLITAKNMDYDIIDSFHNDYESVADFEQRNGVKVPEDIAAMLTQQ